ncbi:hypothetical protein F5Y04DRAFT_122609 [Hypomontagnella monticulosa]|nr:hypothetical protein F5Y04DRAFT_122609 [Hypomontagnella monticulosa]
MLSMAVPYSSLDGRQLDDELSAFLEGPGPAKKSFPTPTVVNVKESPDPWLLEIHPDLESTSPRNKSVFFDQENPNSVAGSPLLTGGKNDRTYIMTTVLPSPIADTSKVSSPGSNNPFRQSWTNPFLSPKFESHPSYTEHNLVVTSTSIKDAGDPLSQPTPVGAQFKVLTLAQETSSNQPDILSPPASFNEGQLDPEEVLVVVIGPRGSGKTTYVNLAKGSSQDPRTELTQNSVGIQSHLVVHLDNQYRLLDTPGFDSELEAEVVVRQILLWLETYYESGQKRENTVILYLHPIGNPRVSGSIRRSLDAFKDVLSPRIWPQVVLGTTGWTASEKHTPGLAGKRESEFLNSSKFWNDIHRRGAGILRVPEQDVFVKDTLVRLGDRVNRQRVQRINSLASEHIPDKLPTIERKEDVMEFERRVLKMVRRIRNGDHRPRLAPYSSAFRVICHECKENIGMETVYQCKACYQDTTSGSFILCSNCYDKGRSCDDPDHRQSMLKKKCNPVSCESHAKNALKDWESIPCSCCNSHCDIVFLHCCDCLQDSFNMCIKCLKKGRGCESENHSLHIVCRWKGQGGLDTETLQPFRSDRGASRGEDDLIDASDSGSSNGNSNSDGRRKADNRNVEDRDKTTTGLWIRNGISKVTADFIKEFIDD